jgi:mRNA interferase HigB
MKVHLIKKQTVVDYAIDNAQSRLPLSAWLTKLKFADWQIPQDIQDTFATADLLGNGSDRIVFDIGGNNYRIICKYYFGEKEAHLFICWIGTHKEYDKICSNDEQYTIKKY